MNRLSWHLKLGVTLVVASAVTYLAQIAVFGKTADTFFYMMQDFAFLPIQVLLVTLILSELLSRREKSLLKHKMNMVIGAFFTEMGYDLLARLSRLDKDAGELREAALLGGNYSRTDFRRLRGYLADRHYQIVARPGDLSGLKDSLLQKRDFALSLLENANLLEHESFTDLLWAISHLSEELLHRSDVENTSETDQAHLRGDVARAYRALAVEWLAYVEHLSERYPYMYSLAVRANPLGTGESVELR